MPNRIMLSLLAAGWCWFTPSLSSAQTAHRTWIRDIDQALQVAESQQRPVLLFVSMDQCKYCQRMAQTTFRDPQVRQTIGTHFVPAVIKNSDRPDLMRQLQIRSFPTTLIVSPQGEVLQQMKGYMDAPTFQQQLLQVAGEPISSDSLAARQPSAHRPAARGSATPVHTVSAGRAPAQAGARTSPSGPAASSAPSRSGPDSGGPWVWTESWRASACAAECRIRCG